MLVGYERNFGIQSRRRIGTVVGSQSTSFLVFHPSAGSETKKKGEIKGRAFPFRTSIVSTS